MKLIILVKSSWCEVRFNLREMRFTMYISYSSLLYTVCVLVFHNQISEHPAFSTVHHHWHNDKLWRWQWRTRERTFTSQLVITNQTYVWYTSWSEWGGPGPKGSSNSEPNQIRVLPKGQFMLIFYSCVCHVANGLVDEFRYYPWSKPQPTTKLIK